MTLTMIATGYGRRVTGGNIKFHTSLSCSFADAALVTAMTLLDNGTDYVVVRRGRELQADVCPSCPDGQLDLSWRERGLCFAAPNPDCWFDAPSAEGAAAVCGLCPVRDECKASGKGQPGRYAVGPKFRYRDHYYPRSVASDLKNYIKAEGVVPSGQACVLCGTARTGKNEGSMYCNTCRPVVDRWWVSHR